LTQKKQEDQHATIRVPKDLAIEVDKMIGKHGFRSRAEIAKEAIRHLLSEYKAKEPAMRFIMRNHDERGVKVWDNEMQMHADIQITPKGIYCQLCDAHKCEHIRFALSQSDVQEAIRKKGWKLDFPNE
jgi:Arc/MetJ-type ribon-helix-helix transcriptional regulator